MIEYMITAYDSEGHHTTTRTGDPDDALIEYGRLTSIPTMTNVLLTKQHDLKVYKVREYTRDLSTGYVMDAISQRIGEHPR